MSNTETDPAEVACGPDETATGTEVLLPREVPLGGPRAMTVRRTLPQRRRSLVGAWCFADHYGPDDVGVTGGMSVPAHPHTGLQTVSWLFTGEIEHRDSAGHHALVRPGELNLMTAGRGIAHSEVSTEETGRLHGVQLWVALPEAARAVDPGFERHVPDPVHREGCSARVFLGSLLGRTSPVRTFTGLVGAELGLDAGAELALGLEEGFEHGLLVDSGPVWVDGAALSPAQLAYLGPGRDSVGLRAGEQPVRLLVLGGAPLRERVVMWWNFVAGSHEEIVGFRAAWQHAIGQGPAPAGGVPPGFAEVAGQDRPPLPAPAMPGVRLRPRQ